MTTFLDTEAFDKIQYPFLIKKKKKRLSKVGIDGIFLNLQHL